MVFLILTAFIGVLIIGVLIIRMSFLDRARKREECRSEKGEKMKRDREAWVREEEKGRTPHYPVSLSSYMGPRRKEKCIKKRMY